MSTIVRKAPNSTMHILTPPCIGLDLGTVNAGACAREGNEARWATTICQPEVPHINDVPAWSKFWLRYVDAVVEMWRDVWGLRTKVHVFYEIPKQPEMYHLGKPNRIPVANWVGLYGMAGAVIGRFPSAKGIKPQGLSDSHLPKKGGSGKLDEYAPLNLIGRNQPDDWRNEHPKNSMREARSAFAIAGAGAELAQACTYVVPEDEHVPQLPRNEGLIRLHREEP